MYRSLHEPEIVVFGGSGSHTPVRKDEYSTLHESDKQLLPNESLSQCLMVTCLVISYVFTVTLLQLGKATVSLFMHMFLPMSIALQRLAEFLSEVDREKQKVEKYAGGAWYPGKLADKLTHKGSEKLQKHQEAARTTQDCAAEQEASLSACEERLQTAQNELQRAKAQEQQLCRARDREAAAVQLAFAGERGDALVVDLQAKLDDAQKKLVATQDYQTTYQKCDGLLTGAEQALGNSVQALEQASRAATMDTVLDIGVNRGPGNFLVQTNEQDARNQGSGCCFSPSSRTGAAGTRRAPHDALHRYFVSPRDGTVKCRIRHTFRQCPHRHPYQAPD